MNPQAYKLQYTELDDSKVFRDAVHNYIYVDQPVLLELINSKEMQRLRRIKQLGGTHQVYQSAEHSRFCHSLGVYFIVRKMIFNSDVGEYINDYDKLTVMCAALLHDIGHGPFSHCFEGAFGLNHEEFTVKIIEGDSEVNHILESFEPGFSKKVSSIIEKKHPNKILIQMISSQLDADRMDYLLRDSYFTGTTYGHFDLYRILRVMKVVNNKIVYKDSGVQAIENYILARYHMYWQVYYHPTSRSYEQLLISIFRRMKDLYVEGYNFGDIRYLLPFLEDNVDEVAYTKLDESIVLYYFRMLSEGKDHILADLCDRFLSRKLFLYQDLTSNEEKLKIMDLYRQKGFDPHYYVVSDDQSQIPYLYYNNGNEIGEIEILVNRELKVLPEVSEIVGAITNSTKNKIDHKIFYPEF
ncbi:HD domain-containing protein [Thomasclavelia sp.]